ncbi:hypothetical protein ACP4OV_027064 [Aristida adscensionis]
MSSGHPHCVEAPRDWADGLPTDVLLAVLHRLDHADVLAAAGRVCRSWRRAARDEPSLWRRVAMRGGPDGVALDLRPRHRAMAREAVRRAAGGCEAFCLQDAGDDGFLGFLSERAPCLKSLCLISCCDVTNKGLKKAAAQLPLLEELELSLCYSIHGAGVYKAVAKACPLLKRFKLSKQFSFAEYNMEGNNDAFEIVNMHGLESLQLFGNALSNKGLSTILRSCPKLESLDIRHCFNLSMDETLLRKCAGIKTLRLPDDPTDDYDHKFFTPVRSHDTSIFWYPIWYSDSSEDSD